MSDAEDYTERILASCGSETVFWDIGAFNGWYSRRVAERGAEVYAFEPQPNMVGVPENVDVFHVALSDSQRIVKLGRFAPHDSTYRIDAAGDLRALAVTMDGLVDAGLEPPTVCKIDVEGTEMSVLRGGENTILANQPTLAIEVHTDALNGGLSAYGHDAADVREWLSEHGYSVEVVAPEEHVEYWIATPE